MLRYSFLLNKEQIYNLWQSEIIYTKYFFIYYLINYFPRNQETPNTVFVEIMQYENVEIDDEEEENLVDDDVEDDEVQDDDDDDDEDDEVEDEDDIVENEMEDKRIEKNNDEKEI